MLKNLVITQKIALPDSGGLQPPISYAYVVVY